MPSPVHALFAVALCASAAHAQFAFTEIVIDDGPTAPGFNDAFPADMDGDGDLDIVTVRRGSTGDVRLYLSDGAIDPTFTQTVIEATGTSMFSVFVADMDNDGDADIVVGGNTTSGGLRWFESDGASPPVFTVQTIRAGIEFSSVFVADMDNDGFPDVVAGGFNFLAVYEHDQQADPAFAEAVLDTTNTHFDIAVADLDLDSDLDIVTCTGSFGGSVLWYESVAGGAYLPSVDIYDPVLGDGVPVSVSIGDLTGDGAPDVLVSNDFDLLLEVMVSSGGANPTFSGEGARTGFGPNFVADLDGDGDLDAVVSDGTLRVYENDGSTLDDFPLTTHGSGLISRDGMIPADLDGDGDTDLIAVGTSADALGWFENTSAPNPNEVTNGTQGTNHLTIADALTNAQARDVIAANPGRFRAEGFTLSGDRPVRLTSAGRGSIVQPQGLLYNLQDGTELESGFEPARTMMYGSAALPLAAAQGMRIGGLVDVAGDQFIDANTFRLESTGTLTALSNAFSRVLSATGPLELAGFTDVQLSAVMLTGSDIDMQAGGSTLVRNSGILASNAIIDVNHPVTLQFGQMIGFGGLVNRDEITMSDGLLEGFGQGVINAGTITGWGNFEGEVINQFDAEITLQADTQMTQDLTNDAGGTITVQNGTLTVLGTLFDSGTIIGDVSSRSAGGLFAAQGYSAGSGATLRFPGGGTVSTGGDYDNAIDDSARYDLASATLKLVGLPEDGPQSVEAMSADIGALPEGLDRSLAGHFPLGALRIGPTATTVNLVDTHDNALDTQAVPEAVYCSTLRIDAGATLNTNGIKVYYETLILDGSVDDPLKLCPIATNTCSADFDNDGDVDLGDFGVFGAAFNSMTGDGNYNASADFDNDGDVDLGDFGVFGSQFNRSDCWAAEACPAEKVISGVRGRPRQPRAVGLRMVAPMVHPALSLPACSENPTGEMIHAAIRRPVRLPVPAHRCPRAVRCGGRGAAESRRSPRLPDQPQQRERLLGLHLTLGARVRAHRAARGAGGRRGHRPGQPRGHR